MPREDTPNFSSTPLEPKKTVKKRTYRRRPRTEAITIAEKKEIAKNLTSIYEDGGRLPDMKSIQVKRQGSFFSKLAYLVVLGGLLAAAAWLGLFTLANRNQTGDYQVKLNINGPTEISVGTVANYELAFQNNDDVILKDVVITVKYPENFVFQSSSMDTNNPGHTEWVIGTLSPRQKGNITVSGASFGLVGQESSWRVFINYQPENFNSVLQQIATLGTKITTSPFTIAIKGPDEAATGGDSQYQFTLVNSGDWAPAKLELIPSWPGSFTPSSSTPPLNKDKKWTVKTDAPATGAQTFTLTGKWSGGAALPANSTEQPQMKITLNLPVDGKNYTLAEMIKTVVLTENTLGLNLAVNGSTQDVVSQPGDTLNIGIKLDNRSTQTIKNGTLKLTISTPSLNRQSALNWSAITDKYDADIQGKQLSDTTRQALLAWTTRHIPDLSNLKAGQSFIVDVSLPVKDTESFAWTDAPGYQITASAQIDYSDENGTLQSLNSNPIVITINSDLKLESRDIISTDSAGKEKHNLTWILTNSVHPLKNIMVSADVFGDITLNGPAETPAGDFSYNPTTKKITWNVPEMPESVDVLALPFSITINTKNPTQNTLVSKTRVQAEDAVTGQPLNLLIEEISLGD